MGPAARDAADVLHLHDGWELACAVPNAHADPSSIERLSWQAATVPGTVASSVGTSVADLDGRDWWFRTRFEAAPAESGEEVVLALDGLATVAEVYLNGERVLECRSMFAAHEVDVSRRLASENELAIVFRALAPLLAVSRRPRARWRTRLVADGNLRFFRTMLLGRAPGFAPGPPAIGPWAPIRLERRRSLVLDAVELRPRLEGHDGVLAARMRFRVLPGASAPERVALEVAGASEPHRTELHVITSEAGVEATGELRISRVRPWWPHTHGAPTLYDARLTVLAGGKEIHFDLGRVGFRALHCGNDVERDGIRIEVNGAEIFARGAVWTPLDQKRPRAAAAELREVLETVVAGGMNMLRVPGTACYESDDFYDLCDELGILVWQDFMFANLDYPEADEEFMAAVEQEVRAVLRRLAGRPSLAVLCGGSEVAQQVAMLGLDPALATGPLFGELLPRLVDEAAVDAPYIPSSPYGGDLPFRTRAGVSHYYGVGAYLRGFEDVRRSEVRFASECLAFANVPDLDDEDSIALADPSWKQGVPRDAGRGWDFEDVRDHYLKQLFGVDPVALRWSDHERYLALSRAVSGEVMAEVFGEWRRPGSSCSGGIVLWLSDLRPGAGWGVLDDTGQPKVAFHHLRRALAPVAVWSTDEGLDGVAVHVANDRPVPLRATLRVSLFRDLEVRVEEAARELELAPRSSVSEDVERLIGRFVDVNWAYQFGPAAQDVIVMSLEQVLDGDTKLLSQAFRFPTGRPTVRESPGQLGLSATVHRTSSDTATATLSARRLVYGVRLALPGFISGDDAFSIEPGGSREIALARAGGDHNDAPPRGRVTALNMTGHATLVAEGQW